jgi:hypothetical protein
MLENAIRESLLNGLAEQYEEDPGQFMELPKQTLASAMAREIVANLRNEGFVEEEVRGVIRFTERGYKNYKKTASATALAFNN